QSFAIGCPVVGNRNAEIDRTGPSSFPIMRIPGIDANEQKAVVCPFLDHRGSIKTVAAIPVILEVLLEQKYQSDLPILHQVTISRVRPGEGFKVLTVQLRGASFHDDPPRANVTKVLQRGPIKSVEG